MNQDQEKSLKSVSSGVVENIQAKPKSQILKVQGLGGKKTLEGTVHINGAKNAVLKAIASNFLFGDTLIIENVPKTDDVLKLLELIKKVGSLVEWEGENGDLLKITPPTIYDSNLNTELDPVLAEAMRASVVLTGPILARYGSVKFPAPGGCVIGARPVDLFVWAYKKMGATVEEIKENNSLYFRVTSPRDENGRPTRLRGAEIFFPIQTVGGTETLMMTAVLAEGVTVLKNCAMEPEIQSLAEFLVLCGAHISGIGTTTMRITGFVPKLKNPVIAVAATVAGMPEIVNSQVGLEEQGLLKSSGNPYVTIPDRIEAGSFLLLASCLGKNVLIDGCNPQHMESLTSALIESGVNLEIGESSIRVIGSDVPYKSFNVRTHEYPGFATDLQPQIAVFLTQAEGDSTIFETIFEGRFKFVDDIVRMGGEVTVMNPREILIKGSQSKTLKALSEGEELLAHDIRAGFAIVMASLLATGTSYIRNVHLIDRGYEKIEERLRAIGADITRLQN